MKQMMAEMKTHMKGMQGGMQNTPGMSPMPSTSMSPMPNMPMPSR